MSLRYTSLYVSSGGTTVEAVLSEAAFSAQQATVGGAQNVNAATVDAAFASQQAIVSSAQVIAATVGQFAVATQKATFMQEMPSLGGAPIGRVFNTRKLKPREELVVIKTDFDEVITRWFGTF